MTNAALLADSPEVYYTCDDTAAPWVDSSGNGRNANNVGGTFGNEGCPLFPEGTSAGLPSLGTYIVTPNPTTWLDQPTAVTFEAWIKTSATNNCQIVSKDNPFGSAHVASLELVSGAASFWAGNSSTGRATAATTCNDNEWHHLAGTWDGTTVRIYVDGEEAASAAYGGTAGYENTGQPLRYGSSVSFYSYVGLLDEIAVFTTAMSAERITAHYTGVDGPPPPDPDPETDLQVSAATSVVETPSWLDVSVSNALPESALEFYVDGDLVFEVDSDDAGQAVGMSVPLGLLAAGTHDLLVLDVVADKSTTVEFEVLLDPASLPAGPTAPTAPTPVPVVTRWTFEDPSPGGETFVFPINPARMSPPYEARVFTTEHTTSPAGQALTFEGMPAAVDWSVEGSCLTEDFYDALERFQALNVRFYVTDHLDRTWVVTFEALDWTQTRDSRHPWGHTYKAKFLIYAGPVEA